MGTLRVVEGGGVEKGIEGIWDLGSRGVLKEECQGRRGDWGGDWGGERRGLSVLDGVRPLEDEGVLFEMLVLSSVGWSRASVELAAWSCEGEDREEGEEGVRELGSTEEPWADEDFF